MNSSAKAPLCGYLYQIRYTLLESIKKVGNMERFDIYIEKDDDASFCDGAGINTIQQIKQHKHGHSLNNTSADLWKTIRIWIGLIRKHVDLTDTYFFLVTTSNIAPNTAPHYLKSNDCRDTEKALIELVDVASRSRSLENAIAYKEFMELGDETKRNLIDRITMLSDNSDIIGLENEIKIKLYYACPRGHIDSFFQRLEGWWHKLVIDRIVSDNDDPINSIDLDRKIESLSDQFKQDNLPIDYDLLSESIDNSQFSDSFFVKQLELIGVTRPRRVFKAIRNFYFAFNQRTRWITEQLVRNSELERYEKTLIDEWDTRFLIMLDEIGDCNAEKKMCEAAKKLYEWVETGELARIRDRVDEQNIARGSYQILADGFKVGWHPQFKERLKDILCVQE